MNRFKIIILALYLSTAPTAHANSITSFFCGRPSSNLDSLAAIRDQVKKEYLSQDPVEALKGEWHFEYFDKDRSIKIEDGHIFYDSKFGKGDIQFLNGHRFRLTFYSSDPIYFSSGSFCDFVFEPIDQNKMAATNLENSGSGGVDPCYFIKEMTRAPAKGSEH